MQVEPRPLYNRIEQEQKYHLQASIFFILFDEPNVNLAKINAHSIDLESRLTR